MILAHGSWRRTVEVLPIWWCVGHPGGSKVLPVEAVQTARTIPASKAKGPRRGDSGCVVGQGGQGSGGWKWFLMVSWGYHFHSQGGCHVIAKPTASLAKSERYLRKASAQLWPDPLPGDLAKADESLLLRLKAPFGKRSWQREEGGRSTVVTVTTPHMWW